MRRSLLATLIALACAALSCSDIPTAPKTPPAPPDNITVEGVITDRDGPGIPNAAVAFRALPTSPNPPYTPSVAAFTDVNGSFRIVLAQGSYEVRIDPGYRSGLPHVSIPKFEVDAAGSRFDYRYSGTRVTGQVTGPGGSVLADASVAAASQANNVFVYAGLVGGRYSMLLPPGNYDVYAESGIHGSGIPSIEVEADISATDTLMNIALTGHQVTAVATIGGRTPLPNVQIYARSDAIGVRAVTSSRLDGSAVLYLPSGGYSFIASAPGGSIVGPETGYWSITGDASLPIDFPGTRWDVTLRRSADGGVLPFASVYAIEIGSNRSASATGDLSGRFQLFVRPNLGYDLRVGSLYSPVVTIPNVSSTADSTFDLFVDVPVP